MNTIKEIQIKALQYALLWNESYIQAIEKCDTKEDNKERHIRQHENFLFRKQLFRLENGK